MCIRDSGLEPQAADAGWPLGVDRSDGRPRGQAGSGPGTGKACAVAGFDFAQSRRSVQADLFSDLGQHVWPLFAEGRLSPQLARTFPIKDAEAAFAELASNTVAGKVVLVIDESLS